MKTLYLTRYFKETDRKLARSEACIVFLDRVLFIDAGHLIDGKQCSFVVFSVGAEDFEGIYVTEDIVEINQRIEDL